MVNSNPSMMYFITIFWLIEGSNGIVHLLVSWRIKSMTLVFQLAVFALIATSSILLISVPVVFASPDGWSSNKNVVFSGTSLWIGLVFLVGILNSLISWTYSSQIQNRNDPPPKKKISRLWDTLQFNISPQNKMKKKMRGGVKLLANFLNLKNTISIYYINNINRHEESLWPDTAQIRSRYILSYMCGYIVY